MSGGTWWGREAAAGSAGSDYRGLSRRSVHNALEKHRYGGGGGGQGVAVPVALSGLTAVLPVFPPAPAAGEPSSGAAWSGCSSRCR